MSDLLSIGKSGVLAYRDALSGISENVVNANNDGFARRQVTIKEQTSSAGPQYLYRNSASFLGVQPATVSRVWDQYKATNAWSANSDDQAAGTKAQYLGTVETTLDDSNSGMGTKLTAIFTSASALAADPEDTTLRQGMIYALSDAVGTIGQTYNNLAKVATTVGDQAQYAVASINQAAAALARINVSLKTAPAGTSGRAALEDQRDTLIGQISNNIGVDAKFETDGSVTLRLNNYSGDPLVSSDSNLPSLLSLNRATDGRLSLTLVNDGAASSASATSGVLAGLTSVANTIFDRRQQLDDLAANLSGSFQIWQEAGTDGNGDPGAALLSGTTALTLRLDVTDPSKIAAQDADGANGNLLKLADLRGSGGLEASWHSIVNESALQVSSAKSQATAAATQKNSAYSDLDSTSGVDLDAEAADLMRYQQAYSASAKIIQTAKDTLQAVLDLL